jgi:RNA polymerase sigma-70 factor, ECF subfamily
MARSDEELVAAGQKGEAAAIDELLRRHYDRIYAVCRRIVGNEADALDATQEALMAIVRGLGRFAGRAKFSTWSYRVASNACLDELRRRARRPDPTDDDVLDRTLANAEAQAAGNVTAADQVGDRLDMNAALQQLPEKFRAPVVLRDMADLDYAEIAEVLDLPPGTVRSRIARGRAALAKILTEADPLFASRISAQEFDSIGNQTTEPERHRQQDE